MLKQIAFALALAAAACSPPASEAAKSGMDTTSVAGAPANAAARAITGAGVVTAIDVGAGTVSLDHEPIAAINWPAMSMQFTVEDPALLHGIGVGDHVSFVLKSETETSVITALRRQ